MVASLRPGPEGHRLMDEEGLDPQSRPIDTPQHANPWVRTADITRTEHLARSD
jgi:hypothetical protein